MKQIFFVLICLVSTSAWSNDSPKALQDAFMAALVANDADGIAGCYTSDATNFAVDSMIGIGPDAVRESWGGFFTAFKVLDATLSDTHLETRGDIAAAWGLFHITAKPVAGGEAVELHGRYMDVSKNIDGNWLYIADHASMPLPPPPPPEE